MPISLATFWLLAFGVAALVLVVTISMTLMHLFRSSKKLVQRLRAYADLPVLAQALRAEGDVARIAAAPDALRAVLRRIP